MSSMEESIIEIFEDHIIECLVDNPQIEAWRFKKPDSRDCQMDLVITDYGMAMFGDYGDMTFRVGRGYGVSFLTNKSKGYVVEKLHEESKSYDLDEAELERLCFEEITDNLKTLAEESGDQDLLELVSKQTNLRDVEKLLRDIDYNVISTKYVNDDFYSTINDMSSFIEDINNVENLDDAMRVICDQDWIDDGFEWYSSIKKPSTFMESRIWALHVMAEKILEYKKNWSTKYGYKE